MIKWCAWCGADLTKGQRKFCNGSCALANRNDGYRERLVARFDAGEELTVAQWSQVATRITKTYRGRDI